MTLDSGLDPWVILADLSEPTESLAQRCRDVIDQHAAAGERENMPTIVQVLARLRNDDAALFAILGGKKTMIEAPLSHEAIIEILRRRFGHVPAELENRIRSVTDKDAITQMTRIALECKDLETFQKSLA